MKTAFLILVIVSLTTNFFLSISVYLLAAQKVGMVETRDDKIARAEKEIFGK